MIDLHQLPSKRLALELLGLEGFVRAVLARPDDPSAEPADDAADAGDRPSCAAASRGPGRPRATPRPTGPRPAVHSSPMSVSAPRPVSATAVEPIDPRPRAARFPELGPARTD